MTSPHVSLTPTNASGLLCNSSPLATAIAVATTEADVHALANVVRGQHAPQPGASWGDEMYGPPQPSAVAVATLLPPPPQQQQQQQQPKRASLSSVASTRSGVEGAEPTAAVDNDSPASSSPPSPFAHDTPSPQQPRVSVVRSGSLPETAAGVAGADAAPGQPFAPTGAPAPATAAASSRLRGKNVSWQCGLCGYHVLAMDQDGTPLPFATSAFGNVLPLMCPRCKLSHTSWQSSTPFSEQGDHLNLPTTYSNRYKAPNIVPPAGASFTKESGARKDHAAADNSGTLFPPPGHAANASGGRTLLKQRAAGASLSVVTQQRAAQLRPNASNGQGVSSSTRAAVQRRAYYCGHCHRRLLRVDANGELVDMDRDAEGHILPIRCPGCGELHSEWLVKPYAVRR